MPSYIQPNSTIKLYSNIENTAGMALCFSSKAQQDAYFASHLVASEVKCTYVRKTGNLKLSTPIATVAQCNYFSFINPDFENHIFYGRIENYEYLNNAVTIISYSIDWWQTYMFDATYRVCNMKREQLSQADYITAKANPFRADIPELLTDEPIPFGPEWEKFPDRTEYVIPCKNAFCILQKPDGTYTEVSGNDPVITIVISPFDVKNVSGGAAATESFFDAFDVIEGKPTAISGTSGYTWGRFSNNVFRPFALCGILPLEGQSESAVIDIIGEQLSWLTLRNLQNNIIGVYVLPAYMFQLIGGYYGTNVSSPSKTPPQHLDANDARNVAVPITLSDFTSTYKNPKIDCFPFKFIRAEAPTGDRKEYKIFEFYDVSHYNQPVSYTAYFALEGQCGGGPEMQLYPLKYKMISKPIGFYTRGQGFVYENNYKQEENFNERITFEAFPQCAYSTDAFLAYLANQYANVYASERPWSGLMRNLSSGLGLVSGLLQGIPTLGGSGLSAVQNLMKTQEATMAKEEYGEIGNLTPSGSNALGQNPEVYNGIFKDAQKAFVSDDLHAGSASGFSTYSAMPPHFRLRVVEPRAEYKRVIDEFFTQYGYSSNETHKPRICNFVKGSQTASELPQFIERDGDRVSYCQTIDMRVEGIQGEASRYIEGLFNAGCLFINGDVQNGN